MNLKIGDTPLIELTQALGLQNGARVFAKLETENAGGSIKDRVALAMVEDAEQRGLLQTGGLIVEATSGNTGIGLAIVAKAKGYKAVIFMPQNSAKSISERIQNCGGEVRFTPADKGMSGSVEDAKTFVENTPNCYYADQFNNPVCAAAHYQTTGVEIWAQTQGEVDIFVAGVGTGGTLTGTSRFLKQKKPTVKAVGVEPSSSPLLSQGWFGKHGIQGIGANFVPSVFDRSVCDEVFTATDEEALQWAEWLYEKCGLVVGLSSGAAFSACVKLASRAENAGKTIVTVFQFDGNRYEVKG